MRITTCLTLLLALGTPAGHAFQEIPPPSGLDPRDWPEGVLASVERKGLVVRTPQERVQSEQGMVAGTSHPFAIQAGVEAIRRGGSAMDAALTASLAQITRTVGSWNSFAGILYAIYFDAETGEVSALNAGYNTLLEEDDPLSIPANPTPSGRTVLVPGFMAGVEAAHQRFGKLPFRDIFEPALYLAENGFGVGRTVAGMISQRTDVLTRRRETREVFTRPDGSFYRRGDVLLQPELAKTLRAVAEQGSSYMYTGAWAERLVKTVREEGGKLSMEDMRLYKVEWEEPLMALYGDYEVHSMPAPELGSVQLIEAVNILEVSGVAKKGHYASSSEAMYWLMQIARLGHLLTFTPDVYQPNAAVPLQKGQVHAADRVTLSAAKANWKLLQEPGWERRFHAELRGRQTHSDANVAVDAEGNLAVVLHSINALTWGTTGIFVDGVSIPDSGAHNQRMIQRVGPGQRLPNITNPMVVTKGGSVILGAAAIGSSLHECMLQGLIDVVDYQLDPWESARSPRFWGSVWRRNPVGDPTDHSQAVRAGAFPAELLDAVRELGQPIEELGNNELGLRVSYWVAVQVDDEFIRKAATPTRGWAAGY